MFQTVAGVFWLNTNVGTPCEDKVNTAKSYTALSSNTPLPNKLVKFKV